VIVRSSANVQAGAQTRMSAILHGIWILAFVALLPGVLRQIPSAALAGVLVVTGWRLVSLQHARHLFDRHGLLPTLIWAATFVTVVATDLLTGVLVGLALTVVELIPNLRKLRLRIKAHDVTPDERELSLEGAATFVQLPKIAKALEAAPAKGMVRLNLERVSSLDHTCAEVLSEWLRGRQSSGGRVEVQAHEPVRQRLALAGEH